ncbi:MAG: 50S ribosomal protein L9 [Candidatus Aminicenantes bacterium]
MKLLLRENIENLGKKGDIVDVAPGHGRNYLIPKKMAVRVTPSNMKMIEIEQKALKKGLEKEMESYNEITERLNNTNLVFQRKTSEKETIYGSVSANDIKESLDKLGFNIEKKRIFLEEPIKKIGTFTVPIKVFHEQQAEVKVEVNKEEEGEEGKKEEKEEVAKKEAKKTEKDKEEKKEEPSSKKKSKAEQKEKPKEEKKKKQKKEKKSKSKKETEKEDKKKE